MSVSKVEICNFALQLVGDESILSLADATVPAQQCNLRYDSSRRAVLEKGYWNFALSRVSLAREATTPVFDFSYQFTLPSDCLKVVGTERELGTHFGTDPLFNGYKVVGFSEPFTGKDRYKIEGRSLLYDQDACKILYLRDFEDTTKFAPLFVEALALYLASRIAYKITGSRTMERELLDEYDRYMKREALLSDSQQGTQERTTVSRLVSTRY